MVDISKLGINPLAFDETIGSTLNDPLPLNAPQQQPIGSPADVLPEERASKFANFVESIATGPEVPGFSLLGALSSAFGQSSQEIETRRRKQRRQRLEDQIFEKQAAEALAAPAATAKRDILKGAGGFQRFTDTGERVFPEAVAAPAKLTPGQKEFQSLIQDLSPEDAEKATRVKLGLDPRAVGAAAKTVLIGDVPHIFDPVAK